MDISRLGLLSLNILNFHRIILAIFGDSYPKKLPISDVNSDFRPALISDSSVLKTWFRFSSASAVLPSVHHALDAKRRRHDCRYATLSRRSLQVRATLDPSKAHRFSRLRSGNDRRGPASASRFATTAVFSSRSQGFHLINHSTLTLRLFWCC